MYLYMYVCYYIYMYINICIYIYVGDILINAMKCLPWVASLGHQQPEHRF